MPKVERISDLDRAAIEAYGDFTVVDEDYGFSVRPGRLRRRRATLVEWTAQYLGFLTIFCTVGAVAGSASLSGRSLDVFELGIFLTGACAAFGFFYLGTRGTAHELQVDTFRRQFRTGLRNHRGHERILEIHDFATVESAFVHKRFRQAKFGALTIRTTSEPGGVVLLSGMSRPLTHLHVILSRNFGTGKGARPEAQAKRAASPFAHQDPVAAE